MDRSGHLLEECSVVVGCLAVAYSLESYQADQLDQALAWAAVDIAADPFVERIVAFAA